MGLNSPAAVLSADVDIHWTLDDWFLACTIRTLSTAHSAVEYLFINVDAILAILAVVLSLLFLFLLLFLSPLFVLLLLFLPLLLFSLLLLLSLLLLFLSLLLLF